jgi:hypothetical protein
MREYNCADGEWKVEKCHFSSQMGHKNTARLVKEAGQCRIANRCLNMIPYFWACYLKERKTCFLPQA